MRYKDVGIQLLDAGFEPIPLVGKRPVNQDWPSMPIDATIVAKWATNGAALNNVGIRCGQVSGIDVDVNDTRASAEIAIWMRDNLTNGEKFPMRFGKRPKFLVPCTIEGLTSKARSEIYFDQAGNKQLIEVLSYGQQFVAYGEHPDTHTEYVWEDGTLEDLGYLNLPTFQDCDITGMLFDYFDELATKYGWTTNGSGKSVKAPQMGGEKDDPFADLKLPRATHDELKKAVYNLPKWVCDDRDEWVKVGAIIHFETSGSSAGYMLFDQWSMKSSKYTGQNDTRKRWESYSSGKKSGVDLATFGSLLKYEEHFFGENDKKAEVADLTAEDDFGAIGATGATGATGVLVQSHRGCTDIAPTLHQTCTDISGRGNQELLMYISSSDGDVATDTIYREFNLVSREDKAKARRALQSLESKGIIEKVPMKRGVYAVVKSELETMELSDEEEDAFPMPLPLGLSNHVRLLPGSVMVVSGSTNSGKTSFVLHQCEEYLRSIAPKNEPPPVKSNSPYSLRSFTVSMDPAKRPIRYLNSEMSEAELVTRLKSFGEESFQMMKNQIHWVSRPRDWSRAINPAAVNVVDYLQIYDNFYEIGLAISQIHEKLTTGIAIVVIQKKPGVAEPRGGEFALERCRLAVLLDSNIPYGGICTLRKVKHPTDYLKNPQGMEIDYIVGADGRMHAKSNLRFVNKAERTAANAHYEMMRVKDPAADFVDVGNEYAEKGRM